MDGEQFVSDKTSWPFPSVTRLFEGVSFEEKNLFTNDFISDMFSLKLATLNIFAPKDYSSFMRKKELVIEIPAHTISMIVTPVKLFVACLTYPAM